MSQDAAFAEAVRIVEAAPSRPPLHATAFLRAHDDGLRLLQLPPYCLHVSVHPRRPSLHCFRYTDGRSDMRDPLVRQCRGLVLDADAGWRPVCYPFDKFSNFLATKPPEIDWRTARVYPKVDGSLMSLYHTGGRWEVASMRLASAEGTVHGKSDTTFAQLFWAVWKEHGLALPSAPAAAQFCFMFELHTADNRVVVPTDGRHLFLTGARHVATMHEVRPEPLAAALGWPTLSPMPGFSAIEDVQFLANQLSPTKAEGFVVAFGGVSGVAAAAAGGSGAGATQSPPHHFNRLKVKSRAYVLTALLPNFKFGTGELELHDLNKTRLLEIAVLGEGEEFVAAFPGLATPMEEVNAALDACVADLEATYASLPHDASFAAELAACEPELPAPKRRLLAKMHKEPRTGVRALLKRAPIPLIVDLLCWS